MSVHLVSNSDPQSPGFYQSGTDINSLTKAGDVNQVTLMAGEEDYANKFLSKVRTTKDWDYFRAAAGTGEQVVLAGDVRLGAIIYDAGASIGNVTVRDSATAAGSTAVLVVSGSTNICEGMRFDSGLTVQAATTGAGLTILYRAGKFAD